MRVLVVDDNATNRLIVREMVSSWGLVSTEKEDGEEGLSELKRAFDSGSSYHLLLLDAQMPEMDGIEATRFIREREKEKGGHIPIVAMTAHAMKGDRERCLDAGMDDYVSKPIKPEQLFSVIEKVVAGPLNKKVVGQEG